MKYIKNIWYILQHKYFVFRAGLATHTPIWHLIIHDWSKWTPVEFPAYAEHFYGKDRRSPNRPSSRRFVYAWLHHIHRNPHHWNHWALVGTSGLVKAQKMPEKYVREMVADWMGAGRSITGKWTDIITWYEKNSKTMVLHEDTRILVDLIIENDVKPWLKEYKWSHPYDS